MTQYIDGGAGKISFGSRLVIPSMVCLFTNIVRPCICDLSMLQAEVSFSARVSIGFNSQLPIDKYFDPESG